MKESRLMTALLLVFGLALAPVAVLAEEEKTEEGKPSAQHDAKGDHAHGGGKTVKKTDAQKPQAAGEKAAVHTHGDHDADDDDDEGSH
jgi:hypothetical protein